MEEEGGEGTKEDQAGVLFELRMNEREAVEKGQFFFFF